MKSFSRVIPLRAPFDLEFEELEGSLMSQLARLEKLEASMMSDDFKTETRTAPKFKAGDVVGLVSTGPPMTVCECRSDGLYDVCWFAGDLLQHDAFAEVEIRLLEARDE